MHVQLFILVKTLIKSSLDNYILPGTLTGSEILWLYMTQWKRNVATLVCASYLLSAHNLKSRNFSTFLSAEQSDDRDTQVSAEQN